MSKKFSILKFEDRELFFKGFVEIENLYKVEQFVEILSGVSELDTIHFEIEHCLVLQEPKEKEEDITESDLDILLEYFDDLLDDGYLYCKEVIEFDMNGFEQEKFIE